MTTGPRDVLRIDLGERSYPILIGSGLLAEAQALISAEATSNCPAAVKH